MMTRWARPWIAIAVVLAMLFAIPAMGDSAGTMAAIAIAAALAVACIVTLSCAADGAGSSPTAILSALRGEDRHHRGTFRRQHAPNTPGRPGRPRAPGRALIGLAR